MSLNYLGEGTHGWPSSAKYILYIQKSLGSSFSIYELLNKLQIIYNINQNLNI